MGAVKRLRRGIFALKRKFSRKKPCVGQVESLICGPFCIVDLDLYGLKSGPKILKYWIDCFFAKKQRKNMIPELSRIMCCRVAWGNRSLSRVSLKLPG